MRIHSHIFISVFLATVLPLVALALSASYYSEYNQQREIQREIFTSLNGLTSEISHELQNSRHLVLGISRAAAINAFIPILESVARDENHPEINLLRRKINHYFEGFQTILPGEFALRILDIHGDTMVKVTHQKTSDAQYENLFGVNYVEHQVATPAFATLLKNLPANEMSFISLPHHQLENENAIAFHLLDYAVPLYKNNTWLGTLVVTLNGEQIDHIVNNATRLYKGKLFIAENNPDNKNRHGLLLYDEQNKLYIAQNRSEFFTLQNRISASLFSAIVDNTEGVLKGENSLIYYSEFFPYPNRLIGWIIGIEINENILSTPFVNNRLAIWLFAAAALFITLILTSFAVKKISRPICHLAAQLKTFADGNFEQRANTSQSITEIQALSSSFNYMADTLIHTQSERDKAQNMMLQNNKLASIGQMAAGIGHEINNPLNNILSYSKLISRTITKNAADISAKDLGSLQHDIDALRNETLRASEIIKGILNFARQMPPQPDNFIIKDWLEKSISLVQQTAKSRHITINCNYNGNEVFNGDAAQLQQVMINLLLNAIQASKDDAAININVFLSENNLEIMIHDQGTGINENDLNKIFDPFFTTKEEGDGSGLGLSISLGIIESHQGMLVIYNNKDENGNIIQGTTAKITLPLIQNRNEH